MTLPAALIRDLTTTADLVLDARDDPEQRLYGRLLTLIDVAARYPCGRVLCRLATRQLAVDVTEAAWWPGNTTLLLYDEQRNVAPEVRLTPRGVRWADGGRWIVTYELELVQ